MDSIQRLESPVGQPTPRCALCDSEADPNDPTQWGHARGNTRRFKGESFSLWRCTNCDTLHSTDAVDLADIYKDYPLNQRTLDVYARGTMANLLKRLEKAGVRRDHRILDFGCGNGLFVEYLRSVGFDSVVGWDPYVPGFDDSPGAPASFDVVIANDVIEHGDDPRAMLEECLDILKPGGILYVGTADAGGVEDMAKLEPHLMRLHQPFHRVILTESGLGRLGRDLGLEVIATYRRSYMDTARPFANYRFLDELNAALDHEMDRAFEPGVGRAFLRRPQLLFYAFFGFLLPCALEPAAIWKKSKI